MPPEVAAKVQPGHNCVFDAVKGLRWTCTRCGDAVLQNGNTIYGSATREPCDDGAPAGHSAAIVREGVILGPDSWTAVCDTCGMRRDKVSKAGALQEAAWHDQENGVNSGGAA
jgi:hypothetical protein